MSTFEVEVLRLATFDSLDAFYAERGGRRSGESDAGVWWRSSGETWRISCVYDTGDVYAVGARTGKVLVLATLPTSGIPLTSRRWGKGSPDPYATWETITDADWYERCGQRGSLMWAIGRLAGRAGRAESTR